MAHHRPIHRRRPRLAAVAGALAVVASLAVAGTADAGKGGGGGRKPTTTTTTGSTTTTSTTTTAPPSTTTTTTTSPTTTSTTSTTSTTTPSTTSPAPGERWIVTVGDSAISGEAGRWAGNTNGDPSRHDTGADAYLDAAGGTAERTPGCHRSRSAEAHVGTVRSLNLACSGARTRTQAGPPFKPGLDFHEGADGRSQLVELRAFASTHDVDAVAVLIGANDFGFADIVQTCVANWMTSPAWWPNLCSDDASVTARFSAAAVDARTDEVATALSNVALAMAQAGHGPDDFTMIVQTYWSPLPRGAGIRYPQSGWSRQDTGGCGVWDRDADWANDVAVTSMNRALTDGVTRAGIANHVVLDMSRVLDGHRLCETGVGLYEEVGLPGWTSPGAADRTEWVAQIRTLSTVFGPYQVQESLHANHWGQLAMRNCLRQAFGDGAVRGGTCVSTGGVNALGEPNMALG